MKKFYRLKFKKNIIIFAVFICLLSITSLIINIIRIVQSANGSPINLGVDVSSMILSVIIIGIVLYSFIRSGFYFRDKELTFVLSIFSVHIPYENTLLLRHDIKNKLLVLYYNFPVKNNPENIKYAIVSIDKSKDEEFITTLKKCNSSLIYEIFDKDKDIKDE